MQPPLFLLLKVIGHPSNQQARILKPMQEVLGRTELGGLETELGGQRIQDTQNYRVRFVATLKMGRGIIRNLFIIL